MEDWEQERAPRKISLREKTSRLLDLPADGVAGVPKVELLGDRELYLENYKGILSYGKEESSMWMAGPGCCGSRGGTWRSRPCGSGSCGSLAGSASWRFCEEGERGRL